MDFYIGGYSIISGLCRNLIMFQSIWNTYVNQNWKPGFGSCLNSKILTKNNLIRSLWWSWKSFGDNF